MYVYLIHDDIHLLYQKEYMRYGGSSIWSPFTCSTKHLGFSQAIIDFSLSGDQYHHLACGGNRKNQKLEQYLENDRKAGNTLEKNTSTSALGRFYK